MKFNTTDLKLVSLCQTLINNWNRQLIRAQETQDEQEIKMLSQKINSAKNIMHRAESRLPECFSGGELRRLEYALKMKINSFIQETESEKNSD